MDGRRDRWMEGWMEGRKEGSSVAGGGGRAAREMRDGGPRRGVAVPYRSEGAAGYCRPCRRRRGRPGADAQPTAFQPPVPLRTPSDLPLPARVAPGGGAAAEQASLALSAGRRCIRLRSHTRGCSIGSNSSSNERNDECMDKARDPVRRRWRHVGDLQDDLRSRQILGCPTTPYSRANKCRLDKRGPSCMT